jgi:hypothetical protein
MFVRVIEQWHDYSPKTYIIDPSKLNSNNYVEKKIIEALASTDDDDKYEVGVYIHAEDCPDDVDNEELMMSNHPRVDNDEAEPGQIANRVLWLTIQFE